MSSHAICALLYLLAGVRAAEQLLEFAQGFFSLPELVCFGTIFDPRGENSEISNQSDALIPGIVTAQRMAASASFKVVTRGAEVQSSFPAFPAIKTQQGIVLGFGAEQGELGAGSGKWGKLSPACWAGSGPPKLY